jgi:hypothetical protein
MARPAQPRAQPRSTSAAITATAVRDHARLGDALDVIM